MRTSTKYRTKPNQIIPTMKNVYDLIERIRKEYTCLISFTVMESIVILNIQRVSRIGNNTYRACIDDDESMSKMIADINLIYP